ncbi:MAG: ribosome small subunit-dependent GTPase A [Lautropia sp.]
MAKPTAARAADDHATLPLADVVAAYGRQFLLLPVAATSAPSWDDALLPAVVRARRGDCVVGDRVAYRLVAERQAVVEAVQPRRNVVTRSDQWRSKTIAANVDQAAVIVSGQPLFDEALLLRVLIALASERIPALLIATKDDLPDARRAFAVRAPVYAALGYEVLATAAKTDPGSLAPLQHRLAGRRTVLLGQSGMGKSTLVNALVPGASQQTAALSEALASGRHTTTFTRAFALPVIDAGGGSGRDDGRDDEPIRQRGWIIDSPGFQSFEVAQLSRWQAAHAMPEFVPLLGDCRFNDCRHHDEPGCAIRAAADAGRIDATRYRLFTELLLD